MGIGADSVGVRIENRGSGIVKPEGKIVKEEWEGAV